MKSIKTQLKRFCTWFYLRHAKLYTLLILIIGIALGCMYEGKDDFTHYFNVFGHTFFMGWIQ